jgi:hypothetical protein
MKGRQKMLQGRQEGQRRGAKNTDNRDVREGKEGAPRTEGTGVFHHFLTPLVSKHFPALSFRYPHSNSLSFQWLQCFYSILFYSTPLVSLFFPASVFIFTPIIYIFPVHISLSFPDISPSLRRAQVASCAPSAPLISPLFPPTAAA